MTKTEASELRSQWAQALEGLEIRHPDPTCSVRFELSQTDGLNLHVWATVRDSDDPARYRVNMAVHSMRLTFFPGLEQARLVIVALWMGYMTHETLELCSVKGVRVIDPHDEPYPRNPANTIFRVTCPAILDPETYVKSMGCIGINHKEPHDGLA